MSVATIAGTARAMIRDFPKYFEVELGPLNVLTIRLPHPLVSAASMQVFLGTPPMPPATEVSPPRPRTGNSMSATGCSSSPTRRR